MKRVLLFSVLCIVIISPIALYTMAFGIGIWSEHSKWSEFGSFFGGVFSPIIASLALVILYLQNRNQNDLAFVMRSDKELEYFLTKLERNLENVYVKGKSKSDLILAITQEINDVNFTDDEKSKYVKGIYDKIMNEKPKDYNKQVRELLNLVSLWSSLGVVLVGLSAEDRQPYTLFYSTSMLKIQTVIGHDLCIALDKLLFINAKSEGSGKLRLFYWKAIK
ncbi:hypothetical protein [Photobacterium sp. DNB22_13_2]